MKAECGHCWSIILKPWSVITMLGQLAAHRFIAWPVVGSSKLNMATLGSLF
jgi:hypothetical protein